MPTRACFLALLLCCLVARTAVAESPKLSAEEVRALADAAALRAGCNLSRYLPPKVSSERVVEDGRWWVSYQGRPPARPGQYLTVLVHDESRATTLYPGM